MTRLRLTFRALVPWHTSRHLRRLESGVVPPAAAGAAAAVALLAIAYASQQPGEITITSPSSETVVEGAVVTVEGTVGRRSTETIVLVVNGNPRLVPVFDGRFSVKVPLLPGENAIHATVPGAMSNFVGGSNVAHLTTKLPTFALWTELTWEGIADVDLHLYLPNGEHCFYSNPQTEAGALLDIDNTDRYGPEHITIEKALPGDYRLSVLYFGVRGDPVPPMPWRVIVRRGDGRPRAFSGVLTEVGEEQTVTTFTFP